MRVVVNEDMKVFHGHVPVELKAGQEVSGGLAELLLAGAPRKVTRLDPEPSPPAAEPLVDMLDSESEPQDVGDEFDAAGSTIDQVLAWVGDSPERALTAHAVEEGRGDKARTRLLAKLAEIGLN